MSNKPRSRRQQLQQQQLQQQQFLSQKPRNPEDICVSILQATMDCVVEVFAGSSRGRPKPVKGARISHIRHKVGTSTKCMDRYLPRLVEGGLITIQTINSKTRVPWGKHHTLWRNSPDSLNVFVITDKGRDYLRLVYSLRELMSSK